MRFTIITAKPEHQPPRSSHDFHAPGGTIGRGRDNNLVLPDNDRAISRLQAIVHVSAEGECRITNRGNVTRVLLNDIPLERGQQAELQEGDILGIDAYRIQVSRITQPGESVPSVTEPTAPAAPVPASSATPADATAAIPSEIWDDLLKEFGLTDQSASASSPLAETVADPFAEPGAPPRNPDDPLALLEADASPLQPAVIKTDQLFNDATLAEADSIFSDATPTTLTTPHAETRPAAPLMDQAETQDPLALFAGVPTGDDPLGLTHGAPLTSPDALATVSTASTPGAADKAAIAAGDDPPGLTHGAPLTPPDALTAASAGATPGLAGKAANLAGDDPLGLTHGAPLTSPDALTAVSTASTSGAADKTAIAAGDDPLGLIHDAPLTSPDALAAASARAPSSSASAAMTQHGEALNSASRALPGDPALACAPAGTLSGQQGAPAAILCAADPLGVFGAAPLRQPQEQTAASTTSVAHNGAAPSQAQQAADLSGLVDVAPLRQPQERTAAPTTSSAAHNNTDRSPAVQAAGKAGAASSRLSPAASGRSSKSAPVGEGVDPLGLFPDASQADVAVAASSPSVPANDDPLGLLADASLTADGSGASAPVAPAAIGASSAAQRPPAKPSAAPETATIPLPTPQTVAAQPSPRAEGRLRIDPLRPTAGAPAPAASGEALQGALLQALLEGLGLNDMQPTPQFDRDNLRQLGHLLSLFAQGTVALLSSRSILKRGVKADMTMVLEDANNPFKLLPSGKSVLMQMYGTRLPGFLPPERAVRDALIDLQAHQLGMIAGIRAIIAAMLQAFNPQQLEEQARRAGTAPRLTLPGSRKAALWDHFVRTYGQIAGEIEDDFHTLFGEAFLHAYDMEVNQYKDSQREPEA